MEQTINVNGEKIESIAICTDGMNEHGNTYSLTIQAKRDLDSLEFTMGMEATLNNAGFRDRHRVVRREFERRKQVLPVEINDSTHTLTIRQIPEDRTKTISSLIIASLQSAKLLNNAEHMATLAAAGITFRKSSDYGSRTARDLGKRVYSITIETPVKPIVPDHSSITVCFKPFRPDSTDSQNAHQSITAACKAIMPEGSEKLYLIKTSSLTTTPTFTIVGVPTEQIDEAAKKLVNSLLASGSLTQQDSTQIYKRIGLTPSRRPPSSGQDRPR